VSMIGRATIRKKQGEYVLLRGSDARVCEVKWMESDSDSDRCWREGATCETASVHEYETGLKGYQRKLERAWVCLAKLIYYCLHRTIRSN
jgi:hypothetical protein